MIVQKIKQFDKDVNTINEKIVSVPIRLPEKWINDLKLFQ